MRTVFFLLSVFAAFASLAAEQVDYSKRTNGLICHRGCYVESVHVQGSFPPLLKCQCDPEKIKAFWELHDAEELVRAERDKR